ncbi:MAG: penicillin-binding transpeptidase domain-containing protein [Eubacteriales bacterium]|nr:penicillin-binding transpeptidase domain-containing protein [Eubacteriales bacterium]
MREIIDYVFSLLKSRILPLALIFVAMVTILINRLFSLQIVNGENYSASLTDSIKRELGVTATRGLIFDRNGVLLAYNDLAFAVKISDSGTYTGTGDKDAYQVKNETINNAIDKTLSIIESKGDKFTNDLPIVYEDGMYSYTVEDYSLYRFIADTYGVLSTNDLTDEQKAVSAEQLFKKLCSTYEVDLNAFSIAHALEIVNLRRYMAANSYNRYMTFTISNEVCDETVAAILENSDELVGVTVEEQYIRRYVNSIYCAHILGYTGTISTSELADYNAGGGKTYENNDVVGKTGIEKALEAELSGNKGSKTVYLDTFGRITEVVDQTDSSAGNDVYLTIDVKLQEKIYNAIEDELVSIITSNMTDGTTKYTYKSNGDVKDIYILSSEVYFALIDNNIISLKEVAKQSTDTEAAVYSAFLDKQASTMEWLSGELSGDGTAYGRLTEEQQLYIWYIYNDLLKNHSIINMNNVDEKDEVYKDWNNDNNTSLKELLTYGISKNWIDMSTLTQQQYTSLSESYDALVEYILKALSSDTSFYKKMYKYMITAGQISGRQVCMLLYEQGVLDMYAEDSQYGALSTGAVSAYSFIYNAIQTKKITPAQLALQPCSGSAVVTQPDTGEILALVSYPGYDNNQMSGTVDAEYYNKMNNDKSQPLLNIATQSGTAPGSTYKPCTAIAALDTGIITPGTAFSCSGTFTKITPSPNCWLLSGHGSETVETAIRDSCNVFFYNVGYNMAFSKNGTYDSSYATSVMQKYAEELGLATKSGIEIDEAAPQASNTNAVHTAIGQGNNRFSTLNLARYVTTLATSGKRYDFSLVSKITDNDGNVLVDNDVAYSQIELGGSVWNAVHNGMRMAAATYSQLSSLNLKIAAKSGTAQERTTESDHSLLISYAPYDNPEICTAVAIQHGYGSGTSMELTADIYKIYYGLE